MKILNASTDVTLGGDNSSNEIISSQKATKAYVDSKLVNASYRSDCPALTPSSGVVTWVINHNLNNTGVICTLYDKDGNEIEKNVTVNSVNGITVSFLAEGAVSAGDFSVVIITTGTIGGGGGSSENAKYCAESPALTQTDNLINWTVTHNLGTTNIICSLYLGNKEIEKSVLISSANEVTITFNSSSNLDAGACKVVILAAGGAGDLNSKANTSLDNITNAGKINIANVSLPSGTYTTLTLGATGTRYTAPADGWYQISKFSSAPYQQLYVTNTKFYISDVDGSNGIFSVYSSGNQADIVSALIPVCKGDKINIYYSLGGATASFKFIYAKGSESEYTP